MKKKEKITDKSVGVIYARYSPGPNQTEQSIEGQVRDCQKYADERGIRIIRIYADRHVSGTSLKNRTEFLEMLNAASSGEFGTVITWKIDRFGRNREEIAINKMKLKKCGVTLAYAKENIPEGPEGILLESLLEGMAEYYSADLAQKIRRGQKESLLKGRYINRTVFYGYDKDKELRLSVNESEAQVVRLCFRMYSEGLRKQEILDELYRLGYRSRQGKGFTQNWISRLLQNRAYIGIYIFSGEEYPGVIPPIIDVELFERVQLLLSRSDISESRVAGGAAYSTHRYLLSSKITCGSCGRNYVGESGSGRSGERYHYYKCRTRKTGGSCPSATYRADELEELIFSHTNEDVLTDDNMERIADLCMKYCERVSSAEPTAADLQDTLKGLKARRKNIFETIELNGTSPALMDRLRELDISILDLEDAISLTEQKKTLLTRDHILCWLDLFRSGELDNLSARSSMLSDFIHHVMIDGEYAHVAYNLSPVKRKIPMDALFSGVRQQLYDVDGPVLFSGGNIGFPLFLFSFRIVS